MVSSPSIFMKENIVGENIERGFGKKGKAVRS